MRFAEVHMSGVAMAIRFLAATVALAWFIAGNPAAIAGAALCGGTPVPLDTSISDKPFVNLTLGGINGNFLLDTAATGSLVDRARYGAAAGSKIALSGFTLPTVQDGEFVAADLQAFQAPAGGELGVVATDFLSLRSLEFHYAPPQPFAALGGNACDPTALRQAGFMQVGLSGYYVADLNRLKHGMPNVPVIGARIGQVAFPVQVDTGFGDFPRGIVQVNTALIQALHKAGTPMHAVPSDVVTIGCSGKHIYERWQIDGVPLAVITEGGDVAASYPPPLLEVKVDTDCGGISSFTDPFGQIGASWLSLWEQSVFDGLSSTVWIPARK